MNTDDWSDDMIDVWDKASPDEQGAAEAWLKLLADPPSIEDEEDVEALLAESWSDLYVSERSFADFGRTVADDTALDADGILSPYVDWTAFGEANAEDYSVEEVNGRLYFFRLKPR